MTRPASIAPLVRKLRIRGTFARACHDFTAEKLAQFSCLKSGLREVNLHGCSLHIFPAFVGELEELEILDLTTNNFQFHSPLDFLIEGCPR